MIYRFKIIISAIFFVGFFLCLCPEIARAFASMGNSPVTSLQNGLVGYWTFDGQHTNWRTGITYDQSGNKNDGTLTSMSTFTAPTIGKLGQALKFDGVDDQVTNATLFSSGAPSALSWGAWVNLKSGVSIKGILGKSNGGTSQGFLLSTQSANRIQCFINSTGVTSPSNILPFNTWKHLLCVWDGTTLQQYVNGTLVGSTSVGSITNSSNNFTVGATSGACCFNGMIDDVRVYNRALSQAEIQQLYSLGSTKFSNSPVTSFQNGLVSYWTFDGSVTNWRTGRTLDSSGNSNTGTLNNFSTSTSPVIGKFGQAILFNGNNSNVNMGTEINFPFSNVNTVTASFWVFPKRIQTGSYILNDAKFAVQFLNTNQFRFSSDGFSTTASSGSNLQPNAWNFITITRASGAGPVSVNLYVNGVLSGSSNQSVTIGTGAPSSFLAGNSSSAFNGILDDLRIYSRILSAQEIQQLYNLGAAEFANSPVTSLQNGLVGYWTFDGQHTNWRTGKTYDQSGNKNDGTLTSMSTSTAPTIGKFGQALKFDGVDDYVQLPISPSGLTSNDISVNLWAKPVSHEVRKTLYGGTDAGSSRFYLAQEFSTSQIILGLSSWNPTISNVVTEGQWQMYTVVLSGTTGYFYRNGVLISSQSSITVSLPSTNIRLGNSTSGAQPYNGSLDDFRIYNRALSILEVQRLYQLGR